MTSIILAMLAAAWLGYFALWYRDRRADRPSRGDGMAALPLAFSAKPLAELLEAPRTRQQAHRRRRQVAAMLIGLALASLAFVPVFGTTALAAHVLTDLVLGLFAFSSVHRPQAPAASLADVRVLYPDRPAPGDAMPLPLRRAASG